MKQEVRKWHQNKDMCRELHKYGLLISNVLSQTSNITYWHEIRLLVEFDFIVYLIFLYCWHVQIFKLTNFKIMICGSVEAEPLVLRTWELDVSELSFLHLYPSRTPSSYTEFDIPQKWFGDGCHEKTRLFHRSNPVVLPQWACTKLL
jgi:hypothetical protein